MRFGRFTRRAALRAGLSAAIAAPLGREAALAAAVTGAAQERPAVGLAGGVTALGVLGRRPGTSAARWRRARIVAGAGIGVATRWVWPVVSKERRPSPPHRAWRGLETDPDGDGVGIVVNVVVLDDPARLPEELERIAGSERLVDRQVRITR